MASPIVDSYIESWRVSDLATAAPGRNWSAELSKTMADPILTEFLSALAKSSAAGTHSVGHVQVVATLQSVDTNSATLSGCIDMSHKDTVDGNGKSVVAADARGSFRRYVETVRMAKLGGEWFVTSADSNWNKSC